MKTLNQPVPPPFRESTKMGDRGPRGHEFSIQLRAVDTDRSLNLGGSVEMIPNALAVAELAVEKHASVLLMPISARRELNDVADDLWTRISIEFYKDPEDAVFRGLEE